MTTDTTRPRRRPKKPTQSHGHGEAGAAHPGTWSAPRGSRNRFNQAAITNFVNQYRSDLAVDWEKYGPQFVARCREEFPQVYASMQVKRLEDELSRPPEQSGEIVFRWARDETPAPPVVSGPPKQLPYHKPSLPADLEPQDWSLLLEVLELCKRVLPSGEDRLPGEVLEVLRKALLEYCREKA